MRNLSIPRSLALSAAALLAACSGSSSGDSAPTVTLAVTDAAAEQLTTFVIGIETVELVSATNPPVSLLPQGVAVDFAALTELSRVLNVSEIPADTYTGIEVGMVFDNDRVVLSDDANNGTAPAVLRDAEDSGDLTGTMTVPIAFPAPVDIESGNLVLELDLDLNQSLEVDAGLNRVYLEPTLIPRLNPSSSKEHAVAGDLRNVVIGDSLFRIGLDAPVGQPTPVVTIVVGAGTVYQINGVCLVGAAGLSLLDTLAPGDWVQAFGAVSAGSSSFVAATVEAGTGSYNGGSDIVEGLIIDRDAPGADGVVTVRGHYNDQSHTAFEFNFDYAASVSLTNTKVVRRGSATLYDTDDLNVGQRVRLFGLKGVGAAIDLTAPNDVVRVEPTRIYGRALAAPASGMVDIVIERVDLRDDSLFDWNAGGVDPNMVRLDVGNLGAGQGIGNNTAIEALGFFTPASDPNADFVAATLVNLDDAGPSLLLVRDRTNGLTTTPTLSSTQIDLAFGGTAGPFERAEIDRGFVGSTDLLAAGTIAVIPNNLLGLGLFTIRDRTLNTLSVYFTFASFSQALQNALTGATLFNFSAVGAYDSALDEIETSLVGVVVK